MMANVKYIPGIEVGSSSPLNITHLFSFTSKPKQNSRIRQIHCKMNYKAKTHPEKKNKEPEFCYSIFTLTHQNDTNS